MKAVYTYWAPTKDQESAGFNNVKEMALFLALSVEYAKKHFTSVELVTNTSGKKILIDKFKIGFTHVNVGLNDLELHKDLWAFAKVKAYSMQKEPFVHIDADCILWQKIPKNILRSKIFFQNKETFDIQPGYKHLLKAIKGTTVSYYCKDRKVDFAYNCGVVGVSDLELAKKWYSIAEDFIFNPGNKPFWNKLENKGQMNYLFEQYFIACIADQEDVRFLIDDFTYENVESPKFKMTHFWGENKKKASEIDKIKARLKKEFPAIFRRINSVEQVGEGCFMELYKKGPDKYKALLDVAVKKKGVKSIVYLGYDGLKSSKYISVNKNVDFIYSDTTKHVIPECDLLIIKDMIPYWSGKQLAEFSKKRLPVKYILDGRGLHRN